MSNNIHTGVDKTLSYNTQSLSYGGDTLLFHFLGDNFFKVGDMTYKEADMDEATITCTILCPADRDPSFTFSWYIDFNGERFYNKTLLPPAIKTTDSLLYKYTLVFASEREDLKRDVFANLVTGENQPRTEYDFTFLGDITQFAARFNLNLQASLGDRWVMTVSEGIVPVSQTVLCSRIKLWDLLKQVYTLYGLRWRISYDPVLDKMVILIMSASDVVVITHEFEYGSNNGLIEIERLNPTEQITTRLSGRGGSKNVPSNYFHAGDPDTNIHTQATYYTNLMPKSYRDYVKGWNGTALSPQTAAYAQGVADKILNVWNPTDYVDSANMAIYGRWKDALEDNEELYPSMQGLSDLVLGRLDAVVAVEAVLNDDYDAADISVIANYNDVGNVSLAQFLGASATAVDNLPSGSFTIFNATNRISYSIVQTPESALSIDYSTTITISLIDAITGAVIDSEIFTGSIDDPMVLALGFDGFFENMAIGEYRLKVEVSLVNGYNELTVNTEVNTIDIDNYSSGDYVPDYKPTFDIWVKNIWDSTYQDTGHETETPAEYASRIWDPLTPSTLQGDMTVMWSSGLLAGEDYEFIVTNIAYDVTVTGAIWRLTLKKSDAELEASDWYLPNIMQNAVGGASPDYFFFINIVLPQTYIEDGEDRVQDYISLELAKIDTELPTYTAKPSKIFCATFDEVAKIRAGSRMPIKDERLVGAAALGFYIVSLTKEYKSDSLLPDWEVVISDKVASPQSSVTKIQGDVRLLSNNMYSNEQAITAIANMVAAKEPWLGNPTVDGYLPSSTILGARSWVAPYSHPAYTAVSVGGTKHFITGLVTNSLGHITSATSAAITEADITDLTGAKEASLGNPGTSGYLLSSTPLGVRSWVAPYSHPNYSIEDGIGGTLGHIKASEKTGLTNLLSWFKLDVDGNIYTEKNFYSTFGVSAYGLGSGGSGGGANVINNLTSTSIVDALSANMGMWLMDNKQSNIAANTYAPFSHTHGNITNGGLIGTTTNLPIVTGAGGILSAKAAGLATEYLNGLGAWDTPPDTVYSHPTYTAYTSGLYKITTNILGHISSATAVVKADITDLGIPAQDTVYSHPTGTGYNHIPTGGTVGQILKNTASGTATWQTEYSYSLPLAASGTRGGIQIGYTATGANIPLLLSTEMGYVTLTKSAIETILTGAITTHTHAYLSNSDSRIADWSAAYGHISDTSSHLSTDERAYFNKLKDYLKFAADNTSMYSTLNFYSDSGVSAFGVGSSGSGGSGVNVIDNLLESPVTVDLTKVLSARQGRVLSDLIAGKANTTHTHLWAHITDKPTAFTPLAHSHEISGVTGLSDALSGKEASLGNPSVAGQILASTTAGVRSWVNRYALPVAAAAVLGGVMQGSNVAIDANGVISVATPYSHPASHDASMINESTTRKFITDTERTNWGNNITNLTNHINNTTTLHLTADEKAHIGKLVTYLKFAADNSSMYSTLNFYSDSGVSAFGIGSGGGGGAGVTVINDLIHNTYVSDQVLSAYQGYLLQQNKEASIAAGTTSQYWRGDKSWQTLNAVAVGLSNVTNNTQWHSTNHPTTISGYGITDIPTSLPASDVYSWAKQSVKPSYAWSEIGSKPILLSTIATNDLGNYGSFLTSQISHTDVLVDSDIGSTVLAYRTFGTAANSATTDFAPSATKWLQSNRDFPNGTLIATDINYGSTEGDAFLLEIQGNSYNSLVPFDVVVQGYYYAGTLISVGGVSKGQPINNIVAIESGGKLNFWFPFQSYWQGFTAFCSAVTSPGTKTNRVTGITHEAKPGTSREVNISDRIYQSWHTGNFTDGHINWNNNITNLATHINSTSPHLSTDERAYFNKLKTYLLIATDNSSMHSTINFYSESGVSAFGIGSGGGGGAGVVVIDNLLEATTDLTKVLSAHQGFDLKTLVDGKASSSHNHSWANITSDKPTTIVGYGITDIPTSLPASDVYSWAKQSSKPSYSWTEIGSKPTVLSAFTNDLGNYGGFVTGTPWTSVGYYIGDGSAFASSSGYNKSNWDTAYGWGNHASGGYATTSSLSTHAGLTTTAHGLGASAFHDNDFFIRNQSASAQSASIWINGDVIFGGADQRIKTGTTNGRTIISNSATSSYIAIYGDTHATAASHIDIISGSDTKFYTSASTLSLTLATSGAATFASTITATGGNSTQWNAAYTYSQIGHLPLAGGTVTGTLIMNTAISGYQDFQFKSNNLLRWALEKGGAETGGNTGADLILYRYNDDGSYLGSTISFIRASGQVNINQNLVVNGVGNFNTLTAAGCTLTGALNVLILGQGLKASFSEHSNTMDVGHESYILVGGYAGTSAQPVQIGHHYGPTYGWIGLYGKERNISLYQDGSVSFSLSIQATSVKIGANWEAIPNGSNGLDLTYGGSLRARLDSSGNITAVGGMTCFAT